MLSEQILHNLDIFLNVGIAFFVLSIIFLVFVALFSFFFYLDKCDKEKKQKDKEKLKDFVSDEIKRSKDKELTAKERALMNMESDIKYICEYIQDYKK